MVHGNQKIDNLDGISGQPPTHPHADSREDQAPHVPCVLPQFHSVVPREATHGRPPARQDARVQHLRSQLRLPERPQEAPTEARGFDSSFCVSEGS